jgi:uncharacterized protein YbbC (DUF1343 family)
MKSLRCLLFIPFLLISLSCESTSQGEFAPVRTGAEMLIENHLNELSGQRIGLVMNPTARIGDTHMLDTLLTLDVKVTALFAPEHGFRGDAGAGEVIEDGVDQTTGLPVYSLYGSNKKPTPEMLEQVDILIFDMQDVGARFYTYNSTMKYIVEAAADAAKEVWILDRPNPAGGEYVAGWVLEEEYESFVGTYHIPVAHGLTFGELALMAEGEGWFETDNDPLIKVIEMNGWHRNMKWPETGLTWIPPSPNLPTFQHAYVYLGTCFIEGTTLSEGRGTEDPFLTIGAPSTDLNWNEVEELASEFGVRLDSISFTPQSIPGKAYNPKHEGERSSGVKITSIDQLEDPVSFGAELMKLLVRSTPGSEYKDFLFLLSGSQKIRANNYPYSWGEEFDSFLEKRVKYLIYD